MSKSDLKSLRFQKRGFGQNLKGDYTLIGGCYGWTVQLFNPNHTGGGAKWPTANLNDYFSATECPIDLKPSCIFKFVRCLKVYEKKLTNLDRGGTLEDPFFNKGSALQGPFSSPFGCPRRSMRVPWALIKWNNDDKCVPWCSQGLQNVLFRKGKNYTFDLMIFLYPFILPI